VRAPIYLKGKIFTLIPSDITPSEHSMDSQETLVDSDFEPEIAAPDSAFGVTTILDFDHDEMLSMDATVRGQSHIRYSVRTVRGGVAGMSPKIVFSQGEGILATVQRRDMTPDLLTLGGETMSLRSWLKTPMFSSLYVTFDKLLHARFFYKV
jgi:hypothetical protein